MWIRCCTTKRVLRSPTRYPRSWCTVLRKIVRRTTHPGGYPFLHHHEKCLRSLWSTDIESYIIAIGAPTALCDAVDPCGYAIIEVELKSNAHTYSNRSNSVRSCSGNNNVNTFIRSYGGIQYLFVTLMILNEKNRQLIFVCYYLWYTIILYYYAFGLSLPRFYQ